MKRTRKSPEPAAILAFGAHPDDIEFGCGGVIAGETRAGRRVHLVVCSRGEAASNGTPALRTREAQAAAAHLGASIAFADLGGDAHFEVRAAHAIQLAGIIRQHRPQTILAPSLVGNQHPDHHRLGTLVRDAARLARYGGLRELRGLPSHAIGLLCFYAVTPEAEPTDLAKVLVDVSDPGVIEAWTASMAAHASQAQTRNYVDFQITRARVNGLRAGVQHAIPLFPNDPLVCSSLSGFSRSARRF